MPVAKVDAEGLGVDQVFEKIPVEIRVGQGVAPPVPGQLRIPQHPGGQTGQQHGPPPEAQPQKAAQAALDCLAEPFSPQGQEDGHKDQQQIQPVAGDVDGDHAYDADGGVLHLPQNEPGDGEGGHQRVEIDRLHQGQQQEVVQGGGQNGPAPYGPQGPQGVLHHLADGEHLPLAGQSHQPDDHAQLIEGQQPGGEEQGQEDEAALQVQEGAQHIGIEGHPHRGHIGLVDLVEQGADDDQGQEFPNELKFQHAPDRSFQVHFLHLTR